MLSSWDAHLGRGVSCLLFTEDGTHLISGGKDSMIHVWSVPEIVEEKGAALLSACLGDVFVGPGGGAGAPPVLCPVHTWSGHSLAVTSLSFFPGHKCGFGAGATGRLLSTSLDHTVKIWQAGLEQPLATVSMPAPCHCATTDLCSRCIYIGLGDGDIASVPLLQYPLPSTVGLSAADDEQAGTNVFRGHAKAVTSLAVSPDGSRLLSASEDGRVCSWECRTRQHLQTMIPCDKPSGGDASKAATPLGAGGLGAVTFLALVPRPRHLPGNRGLQSDARFTSLLANASAPRPGPSLAPFTLQRYVADGGIGAVHQRLQPADLPYILGKRGAESAFGSAPVASDGGGQGDGAGSGGGTAAPAGVQAQLAALQEQNAKLAEFSTQMYEAKLAEFATQ